MNNTLFHALQTALIQPIAKPMTPDQFIRACESLGWDRNVAAKSLDVKLRTIYLYCSGSQPVPTNTQKLLLALCILAGYTSFDSLPPRVTLGHTPLAGTSAQKPTKTAKGQSASKAAVKKLKLAKQKPEIPVAQVSEFSFI